MTTTRYCAYDTYARIYNDQIGQRLSQLAFPPLEQLLLPHLPPNAKILDLCCGTGHLVQALIERGFQVAGLDSSENMLHYARLKAPTATLLLDDARDFSVSEAFHAMISTSDSLNHVLTLNELCAVLQNVYAALSNRGFFLFDLNLETRYQAKTWDGSLTGDVQDDYAWAAHRSYDRDRQLGQVHLTIFQRLDGNLWERSDTTLVGRGYTTQEVKTALANIGFVDIQVYEAERDFDIDAWGPGKVYFFCQK